MVAKTDHKALEDLEEARKYAPEDQDICSTTTTLKARQPQTVKDANGKDIVIKDAPAQAKMFNFLAMGEKALKEDSLDDALSAFLSARQVNEKDPTPLVRLGMCSSKRAICSRRSQISQRLKALRRNVPTYIQNTFARSFGL